MANKNMTKDTQDYLESRRKLVAISAEWLNRYLATGDSVYTSRGSSLEAMFKNFKFDAAVIFEDFVLWTLVTMAPAKSLNRTIRDSERQACLRAVCHYCADGLPAHQFPNDPNWYHKEFSPCKAAGIQGLIRNDK